MAPRPPRCRARRSSPKPTVGFSASWRRRNAAVDDAFDGYEFSKACDALYRFIWDDFCDWYVELAKVQVANGVAHTPAVLAFVLDNVLKLLHPIMPFVTETLWQALTGGESIVIADWPKPQWFTGSESSGNRVLNIQELVTQIRRFRSDQGLKDRQRIPARVSGIPTGDTEIDLTPVFALAWLTESDEGFSPTASVEVRSESGDGDDRTRHVGHRRRRRGAPPPREGLWPPRRRS